MAAKHDSKKARANQWVTHQNLARQKGMTFMFKPKPKAAKVVKAVSAPAEPVVEAGVTVVAEPVSASADTPSS